MISKSPLGMVYLGIACFTRGSFGSPLPAEGWFSCLRGSWRLTGVQQRALITATAAGFLPAGWWGGWAGATGSSSDVSRCVLVLEGRSASGGLVV